MASRIGPVLKFKLNSFARLLYSMMGYTVEEGYDFSKAKHPTEKMIWQMASSAYDYFGK